jgi:putative PIN family toxin of toxin-antitoxin system
VIRAVWDPGVLIAAALNPQGTPGYGLLALIAGRWTLIASPMLLDELDDVLQRRRFRRYLSRADAMDFIGDIQALADVCKDPPRQRRRLTRDPADDYLVALAQATKADCLVSGDRDILDAPDPGVEVITPKAFVGRL